MAALTAPTFVLTREEWEDADFDIPEGQAIIPSVQSDAESDNDEDWDSDIKFTPVTPGKGPLSRITGKITRLGSPDRVVHTESWDDVELPASKPLKLAKFTPDSSPDPDWDAEEEGASTIKLASVLNLPPRPKSSPSPDDDIESAFALPDDLDQLSLRPLHHRASKSSIEGWGDHTSSSTYSSESSSLGFGPNASPSTNSTSTYSQAELETDDEEGEGGLLEGIVVPDGVFESGKNAARILEAKKRLPIINDRTKVGSPDGEDDFEIGLVFDDQVDFSPSRLKQHRPLPPVINRSTSAPPRPAAARPPSRLRDELGVASTVPNRTKSPGSTMTTSNRRSTEVFPPLRHRAASPTPPPRSSSSRAQTLTSITPISTLGPRVPRASSPPSSFGMGPKSPVGSIKHQKSASRLQPISPITTTHRLVRKASLSSLSSFVGKGHDSDSSRSSIGVASVLRYDAPTAASRARTTVSYSQTSSRLHSPDHILPPSRPNTPSSNPAALRLTMPTSSTRLKSRPSISGVFSATASPSTSSKPVASGSKSPSPTPHAYNPSPIQSRTLASGSSRLNHTIPPAAKLLRRPRKHRLYGDGTELDNIEDLPTDRDQEGQFRVAPKGYSSGGRVSKTPGDKRGTIGRRSGQRLSTEPPKPSNATNTTSKRVKSDAASKSVPLISPHTEVTTRRKKAVTLPSGAPGHRRKPTLIRNLSGAGAPKVVGDMKWNPHTLRWEGNEHLLRDFDSLTGSSTRPALITQLTGSSIGSPVSSLAGGARIVGNMIFDPVRMCWLSRLPPEEDEPDVFAGLGDDEDEDWEAKGGTIRATLTVGGVGVLESAKSGTSGTSIGEESTAGGSVRNDTPSPARSHTRSLSESGSERGSRMYTLGDLERERLRGPPLSEEGVLVDSDLWEQCRAAEERHRLEMKGWSAARRRPSRSATSSALGMALEHVETDRGYLFDIRALATKKY